MKRTKLKKKGFFLLTIRMARRVDFNYLYKSFINKNVIVFEFAVFNNLSHKQ